MPVKQATKSANVVATYYEGAFDLSFECVGTMACRFALCSEMPPTGKEECCYRDHGSCRRTAAQLYSLEKLIQNLNKQAKLLLQEGEL